MNRLAPALPAPAPAAPHAGRLEPQRHPAAPVARHRRPGPVGRQRHRLRQVRQRLRPERQLTRDGAVPGRSPRPAPPAATACSRRTAPAAGRSLRRGSATPRRIGAAAIKPRRVGGGRSCANGVATSRRPRCDASAAAARASVPAEPAHGLARPTRIAPGAGRRCGLPMRTDAPAAAARRQVEAPRGGAA